MLDKLKQLWYTLNIAIKKGDSIMQKLAILLLFLLPITVMAKPSYEELCSYNVKIYGKTNLTSSDWEWTGSGVVIKQYKGLNFILTNRHVVLGMNACLYSLIKTNDSLTNGTIAALYLPSSLIIKIGEDEYKAKVIRVSENPKQDMVIILVKGKLGNKKAIKGVATSKVSELIYTVGNPAGIDSVYGEGLVAGTANDWMYAQIPVIGGQNGSGLYKDNGYLTGLVFAGLGGDSARGLAIQAVDIIPFIMDIFYK